MRDLIDERNRREKIQRSVIKRYNVHYITKEELERQQESEEERRAREALEHFEEEKAAKEEAKRLEIQRAREERERLERERFEASQLPSSQYGMKESDEVTKEQVEAILDEKKSALDKVIEESLEETNQMEELSTENQEGLDE